MLGISGKPKHLSPEAFRDSVQQALLAMEPALQIEVSGPLALTADPEHEQPFPIDLTRLYSVYELAPDRLETLVGLYTTATMQVLRAGSPPLSLEMLVPLLRTTAEAGALPACIKEPINDDLVAVYAIDLPGDIALVEDSHLLLLGIEAEAIAEHAAATMDALVDAAQIEAEDGVIAITAEGGNASSFAFSLALWEQPGFAEMPAIAVIAPERDLLLAFDPHDEVAAENALAIAADVHAQSEAPLSLMPMYVKGSAPEAAAPLPPPEPEPQPEPVRPAPAPRQTRAAVRPAEPAAPARTAPASPAAAVQARPTRVADEPEVAAPAPAPTASPRIGSAPSAIRQLAANMRRTS
jgi:hypothetical protein